MRIFPSHIRGISKENRTQIRLSSPRDGRSGTEEARGFFFLGRRNSRGGEKRGKAVFRRPSLKTGALPGRKKTRFPVGRKCAKALSAHLCCFPQRLLKGGQTCRIRYLQCRDSQNGMGVRRIKTGGLRARNGYRTGLSGFLQGGGRREKEAAEAKKCPT
jgi:hypothetical protein